MIIYLTDINDKLDSGRLRIQKEEEIIDNAIHRQCQYLMDVNYNMDIDEAMQEMSPFHILRKITAEEIQNNRWLIFYHRYESKQIDASFLNQNESPLQFVKDNFLIKRYQCKDEECMNDHSENLHEILNGEREFCSKNSTRHAEYGELGVKIKLGLDEDYLYAYICDLILIIDLRSF